jgi:chromosomal replication initiator protein
MDKIRLWSQAQAELALSLSQPNYKLFFSNTKLETVESQEEGYLCQLSVPNIYIKESLAQRYGSKLQEILEKLAGKKVNLIIKVRPVKNPEVKLGPLFETVPPSSKTDTSFPRTYNQARLQPSFTFDNFAVSSSNEMAYAAAKAVSQSPGKAYNPLFFYGGVGVGKTHLMQAIANSILGKKPHLKAIYCTGEEFTNEIIDAIQTKRTSYFHHKFRSVGLLIIDDIQFIAGKNTVQEEFFHTFNAIRQEGNQIILSSDRPPSEIQRLEERLASRFEAGLIVDIQEPNFELRTAILLIKSKVLGLSLPMDVAQLIATQVKSTRKLEGTLIKIKAFVQAKNTPLTPQVVAQFIGLPEQKTAGQITVKPKDVIFQVASQYNLKTSQLTGKERHQHIVLPRQIAMFILRHDSRLSLVEVGRFFGNRDHTTVMHSVAKIESLLSTSSETRLQISQLRKSLGG